MKCRFFTVVILMSGYFHFAHAQAAPVDSVIQALHGCWRWDYYYGGIAGFPLTPAWAILSVKLSQDAQDSADRTVSYWSYLDWVPVDSGRAVVGIDTGSVYFPYFMQPDIFASALGMSDTFPIHFILLKDTLEFTHAYFADDFFYGFVKDSCPSDTRPGAVDSIIQRLIGCWKWDHYFGGFAGLPPTPAWSDVKIHFSQDVQDSLNHTVSCSSYQDTVLQFAGRCSIDDSTAKPFFLLSCPIFNSIGIVGSPPLYVYFEDDTLLFPQQQFVDGFVYAFLQTCVPVVTTGATESGDDHFMQVYSHAASENLIISIRGADAVRIALYDVTGRKLAETDGLYGNKYPVDISKYRPGVYFITVETQKKFAARKIILD